MTFSLLFHLFAILIGGILLGSLLCLPLYKWNVRKFIKSSLFTKIMWWIPIFAGLVLVLYGGTLFAVLVALVLIRFAVIEFLKNRAYKSIIARVYLALFVVFIAHLALWFWLIPTPHAVTLLASVAIISVFSDVFAFFLGNYLGKHHLPAWLNQRKSWEGVAGQIIGAFFGGLVVVLILGINISVIFVLAIGLASAFGDLANSAAKRSLGIKDWGNSIPGHGGFLDRFSSLSCAIAVSFWLGLIIF